MSFNHHYDALLIIFQKTLWLKCLQNLLILFVGGYGSGLSSSVCPVDGIFSISFKLHLYAREHVLTHHWNYILYLCELSVFMFQRAVGW